MIKILSVNKFVIGNQALSLKYYFWKNFSIISFEFGSINRPDTICRPLSFLLSTIIIVTVFSLKTIIPLNKLSKAALRVSEGDLTTQVDLQREDKIGMLAYSFNDMVETLRKGKELEEEYTRKLKQEVDGRTLELKDKND